MPERGNKGEWGEPYVVLSLLGKGKIFMSDANGKKISEAWMNIMEIIRKETSERIVFYNFLPGKVDVNISINGKKIICVPASSFLSTSRELLREIKSGKGRSFSVSDEIRNFLDMVEIKSLKAKARDKNDIYLSVVDPRSTITRKQIGFSIKTKFGHDPTLFNTAPASGARYELTNMTDSLMREINGMIDEKGHAAISKRCSELSHNGCKLLFVGFPEAKKAKCAAFKENLDLVDPRLPVIIERILRNHFFLGEKAVDLPTVVDIISKQNPCKLTRPDIKYQYIMKSFVYAAYCGLTASSLWDGKSEVNGGYITVDENGEILANYAMESEAFKAYLFQNCYLEFPSTSKSHGDYAKVYKQGPKYYFNLNFQIRCH